MAKKKKVVDSKGKKCAWCGGDAKDAIHHSSNDEHTCGNKVCEKEYKNSRGIK